MATSERYHRQTLLPQIGSAGQERLGASQVLLVGCGALGCNIAQHLVRAGVGHLRIVDRDLVEMTNLQRQVLYTQADTDNQTPKAIAAAGHLRDANPSVTVEPVVADVNSGNIAELAESAGFGAGVILDGTDNVKTRYLINDLAVREGVPWIYGACIGMEGRAMAVVPGKTACLRCVFPEMPSPGELATCDTVGVLGPAAAMVGSMQASMAIRFLVHGEAPAGMLALDAWDMRLRTISTPRQEDCICCGQHRYEVLDRPADVDAATMCGRDAVQVRAPRGTKVDLLALADRLRAVGSAQAHAAFLRFRPAEALAITLSVFPDGRVIVNGTSDIAAARSLVARYVGS